MSQNTENLCSLNQPYSDVTFSVLAKYGVTLAEYYVMGTVGYEIFLPKERLAKCSFDHAEGDPRGEVDVSEHLNAINSCLEKGWFEILTIEKCKAEMARQESVLAPDDVYNVNPGEVSLTNAGYLLYKNIILEIYGAEHVRQMSFMGM